ncbi:MAG: glucosamine-6-phosphate deaminase [Firmicutes bacterium]|nr:glucosamine-6-phosphate deaminase [Bacillota bacterium]
MVAIEFRQDQLEVVVSSDRKTMGSRAAKEVGALIKTLLASRQTINMMFAAAPSQSEFLDELLHMEGIDWSRINGFHLDEYVGLEPGRTERFEHFLRTNVFERASFKNVYYIDAAELHGEGVVERYSKLLREHPIDIACIGIGENGHIAFNDPPVADFADTHNFKVVELDDKCRTQQVNDGCFPHFDAVPTHAYTVTVPGIMSAQYIACIVPSKNKSEAVKNTLLGPIDTSCPASVLRTHQRATLYLDRDAASLVLDADHL